MILHTCACRRRDVAQGVNIEYLFRPEPPNNNPLPVWYPDVEFRDAYLQRRLASVFRLRPHGEMYTASHLLLTLGQPNLDFTYYPLDKQNIELVLKSYAYNSHQLKLEFVDPAVVYVSNFESDDIAFEKNVIWYHKAGDWTVETGLSSNEFNEDYKEFYVQKASLEISRYADGVILRFVVPIFMLCILCGWMFWTAVEQRASATLTVLIGISALYIIIFSSYPLTGYLSTLDSYIVEMYVLIVICVGLHQLCERMVLKSEHLCRPLMLRLIESFGRLLVIPLSTIGFFEGFRTEQVEAFRIAIYVVLVSAYAVIIPREIGGMRKTLRDLIKAMDEKRVKMDEGKNPLLKFTHLEFIIYCLYYYWRCSSGDRAAFNVLREQNRLARLQSTVEKREWNKTYPERRAQRQSSSRETMSPMLSQTGPGLEMGQVDNEEGGFN